MARRSGSGSSGKGGGRATGRGGAPGDQMRGGEGEAGGESKGGEVCARKGAVRRSVRCSGVKPKMLDAESMI